MAGLVVAYEPVWAIGTGRTARGSDAAAMAEAIRRALCRARGRLRAASPPTCPCSTAGSVTAASAGEFLAEPAIDGALVGGASLKVEEMAGIVARAGLTAAARRAAAERRRMSSLVLLRHGESDWNRENRFTGWTDVDLSEAGLAEAHEAGRLLREAGFEFDVAFTSVLRRAIRTLWIGLDELDRMWLPVVHSWRLNERHYGALQGLNKAETAAQYGDEQVHLWRRSYDVPPPPLPDRRRARARPRPALCRPDRGRAAPVRVAQGHGRPLPAGVARADRAQPSGPASES